MAPTLELVSHVFTGAQSPEARAHSDGLEAQIPKARAALSSTAVLLY